jgi:hypothetical protein
LCCLSDLSFFPILSLFLQDRLCNAFPGCDAANNALYLHSGGNEWLIIREPIVVACCWVNWRLRGCFPLDFRPLCWAASRALWDLKTGGNLPGTVFPKFPPIASRDIFSTPYPIWRPQHPPAAQRNRPFFSRDAPAGHEGHFFDPIPHLEAPAPPCSPAKPAIFF